MSHPRLSQLSIDEVNEAVRGLYQSQEEHVGFISPVLKMLARRPEYVDLYRAALRAMEAEGSTVTATERYLIMARLAMANHSPYAAQQVRTWNATTGAMPAEKLEAALRTSDGNPVFTERERLVLELGDRIASGVLDDAFWAGLHEEFSDAELLDLLVIASVEGMFATFTRAVGLTSLDMPDFQEPETPWGHPAA
ncbi:MAG TPA: hypothetical protein VEI97_09055 [bacterium]|nr:hypothetical protein [bacterium]